MKEKNSVFKLDESTINKTYKYLKYVDNYGDQTLLFFLSDDDYCTHSKLMVDYIYLKNVIDSLNNKFEKKGDLAWFYIDKKTEYIIQLEKEEWFFTVVTKKKEK